MNASLTPARPVHNYPVAKLTTALKSAMDADRHPFGARREAHRPDPEEGAGRRDAARVSVEGGGCSGFQYKFDIERAKAADDLVLARDGAVVLIDPVSLNYLQGSEIDFVDDLIGAVVQDQQSAGDRLLRLRHELFALATVIPFVPANAGTQFFGSGFPLARE